MMTHFGVSEFSGRRALADAQERRAEDFDRTCDWIETLLSRLPDPSSPAPALSALSRLSDLPMREEEERHPCLVCAAETALPLLCSSCLAEPEQLPEDLPCPWHLGEDWCAARVDQDDGELVETACEGRLCRCEQRAVLGLQEGARR